MVFWASFIGCSNTTNNTTSLTNMLFNGICLCCKMYHLCKDIAWHVFNWLIICTKNKTTGDIIPEKCRCNHLRYMKKIFINQITSIDEQVKTAIVGNRQYKKITISIRADSRLAPNQWETSLQSNAVFPWLGVNLDSALRMHLCGGSNITKSSIFHIVEIQIQMTITIQ